MLTFLRRIRRSLIESGSARRYILYAIGEIALVVIGILIALQINNWNTYSNERDSEREYLVELREDLISDTISLNGLLQQINGHIYHATAVIDFIETGAINDTISLVRSIVVAGYMNFFNPNLSTYNDLINSGNVRLILDHELKRKLDEYVSLIQQTRERYELNKNQVWFDYTEYYKKQYIDGRMGDISDIIASNIKKYPIDWYRMSKDRQLKHKLTWVIGAAQAERRWQKETLVKVIELTDHVDHLLEE